MLGMRRRGHEKTGCGHERLVERIERVQQLEWTCDQTSDPPQAITVSMLATAHRINLEYVGERGKGGSQFVDVHG
jgi:hypothetical protein